MRNAEDRLPKLRLLRILILLRFIDGPVFERTGALFNALEHALAAALFPGRKLLCLFGIFVHLVKFAAHTLIKAPSSSNSLGSPFGQA